ncbi:MAG: ABC transporter substrate-binding protein [Alphaproteobacteria bacterium]|nr:ABC transporter substrate-binding protein [Alphaproteobacteria bacterium]
MTKICDLSFWMITRRACLRGVAAGALGVSIAATGMAQAAETIKLASIFDLTGGLNIYGIQQSRALDLAVESINAGGGVLGKQLEPVKFDAQSELAKYTQYTNTAILRDKVSVLFAGLTSSSREAIRPIIRRNKIPYFYSALYEGGACDKYTFITGASASQQMSVLIEWGIKKYGPKIFTMAPDYNFGTISAHWVKLYAEKLGGEVLGEDFLPLTLTDYSPTIQKIQAAKPDFVVALPVGANQTGFLEQFAAAGLKEKIGIVSTNYGSGNQQVVVSPDAGEGIIASQEYFMWIDEPKNEEFKAKWKAAYGLEEPIISEAADVWNAVHIWAKAVEKAGTVETDAVIAALESGLSFEGPNGLVTMQPGSHHLKQNIYIVRGNRNHGFDVAQVYEQVEPSYEDEVCDLIKNPDIAEHFVPEGL